MVTGDKVSDAATFETAKMNSADWDAAWISDTLDMEYEPAPMLRKEFSLESVPSQARAYISAAGYYDLGSTASVWATAIWTRDIPTTTGAISMPHTM